MAESTHRHILRATTLVGGATLGALIIGLARNKLIALLGGPAAIGLLGLFTAIVTMASAVAMFGLNTSVVRQLAPLTEHPEEAARIRRSMWTLAWPLALIAAAGVWIAREPLAVLVTDSALYAAAIGLLSLGVIAAVIGELQLAVLQSYGRLGDVARVKLWGSLGATALAIGAVAALKAGGIVLAVLAVPAATAVAALWFARRLPSSQWGRLRAEPVTTHWPVLLGLGAVFMLTSALAGAQQLAVRGVISRGLGLDAAGLYQAASSIMWVNLSLVLNAMAADYYPRLARARGAAETGGLLNSQLHSTTMLAAPALAATCVAAPLALTILFSSQFTDAATLLRLLCATAVLRIPIWALGFVLLTRGAAGPYLLGEVVSASVVPLTWLLLPSAGLEGAGWAAVGASVISLGYYSWQVNQIAAIRIDKANALRVFLLFLILLAVILISRSDHWAGLAFGAGITALISWQTFTYLRQTIVGSPPPGT